MFKRILMSAVVLAVMVSTLGTGTAVAQELRIGYVEPQAILEKMPEMKAVQQKLQNFIESKQEEFAEKQTNFQQQVSEFEQRASVISEEAKQKEEERLGQMQAELQQAQTQFEQEVQQRQQELMGPLFEQINSAISTVANRRDLTYVFNTATNQGDVIILYASQEAQEQYDITDEVMQELDI